MRAVIAPMVADRSFYEAIPGLARRLAAGLAASGSRRCGWRPARRRWRRCATRCTTGRSTATGSGRRWRRRSRTIAPTSSSGCAELAREFDVGLHSHVAESKVQAVTGIRVYGKTQTAHLDELGVLGPHFTVAHGVWLDEDDMAPARRPRRLGRAQPGQQHAARLRPRRCSRDARAAGQSRHRHRRRLLLRQPEHVRGDAAGLIRLEGAGAGVAALADDARSGVGGDRGQRPRPRLRGQASGGSRRATRPTRAARPRPSELAAAQRPGQPAGPLRGRHRGPQRHDRRPDGRREPPGADGRSRPAARPRRRRARPPRRRQRRQPAALRGTGAGGRQLLPGLARTPYHVHRYGARLE